jgi:ribosomal protein L7Ae-like RNA K-turn-binding protein
MITAKPSEGSEGDKVPGEIPGPEDEVLGEEDGDVEAKGRAPPGHPGDPAEGRAAALRGRAGRPAADRPGGAHARTRFVADAAARYVATAAAKGLFAKAARRRVVLPSDLAGEVEQLLRARCLALLGLARRAGQLRTGFEKVREDLKAGRAGLLLAARDGAPDGRQKLAALAGERVPVALFDSEELSLALGRERVVHAVVAEGGIAQQLRRDLDRLQGMQAADSARTEI